jgi:hypothetical protein
VIEAGPYVRAFRMRLQGIFSVVGRALSGSASLMEVMSHSPPHPILSPAGGEGDQGGRPRRMKRGRRLRQVHSQRAMPRSGRSRKSRRAAGFSALCASALTR